MPNRLAASSSPYLLQHADNPVDWWEWGDDAFAEARRLDVPVLLSVGYAACHWCHVMAHESFEDAATARLMNQGFVNIKVDREERPDVDAVYMEAVQGMTGQGGWPMTVFLTAEGEPFYAGTYFPPQPRHGLPSFAQVLTAIATTWRDRREEVLTAGKSIAEQLAQRATTLPDNVAGPPDDAALAGAVRQLARDFDPANAGFGGAPKFPPSMTLEHLLRHHARTGDQDALDMVVRTCEAMARGGMYDQLGGGFARYSTDVAWVVPHFEKMLYDNALLLRVYAHLWRSTGSTLAARVALETGDFMLRDLRTAQGGFASSLDADSEGVEGRSYVWTPDQLREVLADDADWAAGLLQVTPGGTFEHGSSVLQLRADPDDAQRWSAVRSRLFDARSRRTQPTRDDKVVAAWNGLAIAALAEAGALLDRDDFVHAASAAADLLLDTHVIDGRLRRVSRDGSVGAHAGVLEDYGDLAEGLLTLYAVTSEAGRLHQAGALLDVVLQRFRADDGAFFDTADDAERLLRRPQDPTDNATPSGWSAACGALLSYAAYTGSVPHRDAAEAGLAGYAALARRAPRFAGWGLAVAEAWADGPREAALVGDHEDPDLMALHRTALRGTAPGLVVAVGEDGGVPLLRGRLRVDGRAAAYVCRGFVCERPVTTPKELAELIGSRG